VYKKIDTVRLPVNKKEINPQDIKEGEVLLRLHSNITVERTDNTTITKIIIVKPYKIKVKNS
jgi:hypothetical protein